MTLKPPPTDTVYNDFYQLRNDAQNHAASQGYALKASRYRQNKDGEYYKVNFLCDLESKPKEKISSQMHQHTNATQGHMCRIY